jgi:uncharacterized protein YeaO (DUF488 family)
MKIATSYFAVVDRLPPEYLPVGICATPPKGWRRPNYSKLAPPWPIVSKYKQDHDEKAYEEAYNEQVLAKTTIADTVEDLKKMLDLTGKTGIALLCYEKSEDFCHRRLVAKWLGDACEGELELESQG